MAKPSWISVNPSSGKNNGSFDVTCAKNDSYGRQGVVSVSGGGL